MNELNRPWPYPLCLDNLWWSPSTGAAATAGHRWLNPGVKMAEPLPCQRHLFGLPSPGTTPTSPLYLNGASRSPLLSSVAAVGRVSKAASTPFKSFDHCHSCQDE